MNRKCYRSLSLTIVSSVILLVGFSAGQVAHASDGIRAGAVIYTCNIHRSKPRSEIGIVDKSEDWIPMPKEGATCAQYTGELLKAGECVFPPVSSCSDLVDLDAPLPAGFDDKYHTDWQQCINFLLYGPAFC